MVVGRRGGKSLIASLVAVYLACFKDYSKQLAPGERGTLMIIAADRRQARIIIRYIQGFFEAVPMLGQLVDRKTQDTIDLTNRVTIEVHTASFRSTRGYSIVAAICDELSFWRDEKFSNPDTEILNALRPGMATIPGSLLLCISSPYARTGEMWKAYRRHYGQEQDDVLVWQADTRSMNPTVPQEVIDQAIQKDPAVANAEYNAQFRTDVEALVTHEAVEALVVPNRSELPVLDGIRYYGFVDPSGGSQDSMTLTIAHHEHDKVILDAVRERRPPFSPDSVTREFCQLLKLYMVMTVVGDRYGGEWCREVFRRNGVSYRVSDKVKSDLYLNLLPLINSGRLELLAQPVLINQLVNLERRTSRGGRDSIDHAPGARDDVINAAAGAIVLAAQTRKRKLTFGRDGDSVRRVRNESAWDLRVHRPYPAPPAIFRGI